MKLRYAFLLGIMLPVSAFASSADTAPLLTVIPEKSKVTFTATQNHAPVIGEFTTFTARIYFAEDKLPVSSVKADIDLGSVKTDYTEIATNLLTSDWFAVARFPKAVFESKQFKHLGGNRYDAVGTLTLRDKTLPVTLPFTITHANGITQMVGETTLKRTAFGVGQGEWASTSTIADEVKVTVVIEAKKN